jgi:hypothetical protein
MIPLAAFQKEPSPMSVIRYHEAASSYGNGAWMKRNIACRNMTNQSFGVSF